MTAEREGGLGSARVSADAHPALGVSALRLLRLLRLGVARGRFSSTGLPILFTPEI